MTSPELSLTEESQAATAEDRDPSVPVLSADRLTRSFPLGRDLWRRRRRSIRAVDSASLSVRVGETVGVVGESGSGKSTLGRLLARLTPFDSGTLFYDGGDVSNQGRADLRAFRRDVQLIHQDPYGSLDPTKTAGHAISEPLVVHRLANRGDLPARASELAERVALDPQLLDRRPGQLSGGQRQRVSVARSLSLGPRVLVADEPTSALDLSTRSEILNLLLDLQRHEGLAIVLISHDFATVSHLSHRIAVMYLGRIVEEGPASQLAESPLHPYTEALLSAVPVPNPAVQRSRRRIVLEGEIPSPDAIPSGCRFRLRCAKALPACETVDPQLVEVTAGHRVACLLYPASGHAESGGR